MAVLPRRAAAHDAGGLPCSRDAAQIDSVSTPNSDTSSSLQGSRPRPSMSEPAVPRLTGAQVEALQIARVLIKLGMPVFAAAPSLVDGVWDPSGGTGANRGRGLGYWLPRGWQMTTPDLGWLDPSAPGFEQRAWRPGWALCMVTGVGLDVLDVDPRHGGDDSRTELIEQGLWPTSEVLGIATTPSGGTHEFIRSLSLPSKTGFRPGLDFKGGTDQGRGRGFAFVSPTMRRSKSTQELASYAWTIPVTRLGNATETTARVSLREVLTAGQPALTGPAASTPDGQPDWVENEAQDVPCAAVQAQERVFTAALEVEGKHTTVLRHVLSLMRKRQQGHRGVAAALHLLRKAFVEGAERDSKPEAEQEFDRLVTGA